MNSKKRWDTLRNTAFEMFLRTVQVMIQGQDSTQCEQKSFQLPPSLTDVTVKGQQNIDVNILAQGHVDLGLWIPILHQPGGHLFGSLSGMIQFDKDIRQTCFRFLEKDVADSSLCHSDMRGMIEMWDMKTLYLVLLVQTPQWAITWCFEVDLGQTVQELNAMLAAKPGESPDRIWYYFVLKMSSPDYVVLCIFVHNSFSAS